MSLVLIILGLLAGAFIALVIWAVWFNDDLTSAGDYYQW